MKEDAPALAKAKVGASSFLFSASYSVACVKFHLVNN